MYQSKVLPKSSVLAIKTPNVIPFLYDQFTFPQSPLGTASRRHQCGLLLYPSRNHQRYSVHHPKPRPLSSRLPRQVRHTSQVHARAPQQQPDPAPDRPHRHARTAGWSEVCGDGDSAGGNTVVGVCTGVEDDSVGEGGGRSEGILCHCDEQYGEGFEVGYHSVFIYVGRIPWLQCI